MLRNAGTKKREKRTGGKGVTKTCSTTKNTKMGKSTFNKGKKKDERTMEPSQLRMHPVLKTPKKKNNVRAKPLEKRPEEPTTMQKGKRDAHNKTKRGNKQMSKN